MAVRSFYRRHCRPLLLQLLDTPNLYGKSRKMMSSSELVPLLCSRRIHYGWRCDVILFLNNFSSRLAQIRTFRI